MHIMGGNLKRTPLMSPPLTNQDILPISAKLREALMSMCCDIIHNAIIWDMFSGTGSFGFEAASRGAKHVIFFEKHHTARLLLTQNMHHICKRDPKLQFSLIHTDLLKHRNRQLTSAFSHKPPQLIFADPPYQLAPKWLKTFLSYSWHHTTDHHCHVIVKSAQKDKDTLKDLFAINPHYTFVKQKHYGNSTITVTELVISHKENHP